MLSYHFRFDIEKARQLRDAVNDRQKQSVDNIHKHERGNYEYRAWNRTCAVLDRLEDTILYLNNLKLGKHEYNRSAFDFYDFINNACVVIDCIKTIGSIFKIDDKFVEEIENSSSVFGNFLGGTYTDQRYFEYIRSLCSVHPLCTNHQTEFLHGSKFHCCPYVRWEHGGTRYNGKNADLTAVVFPADKDERMIYIGLYISEFEQYLQKWIDLIPRIIEAKNEYTDRKYEELRKEPVKELCSFEGDVISYLDYLHIEYCRRFDYLDDYLLDDCKRYFSITLSDKRNASLLQKYQSAILYSLPFVSKSLQNMSIEGYENNGLKYPEKNIETTLFDSLLSILCYNGSFSRYSYHLEKSYYLSTEDYSEFDKMYARRLLEEPKALINKYVHFTNEESDEEALVLVQLALYFDALSQKCLLNRNIPNELEYRNLVLTDEQFSDLFEESQPQKESEASLEKLYKIIEEYGC